MRWFFSPLLIVIGILLMKYTVGLTKITGPVSLAEKYLAGFGGTFAWWRIWGVIAVIFGMLWLTGIIHYDSSQNLEHDLQGQYESIHKSPYIA